MTNPALAFPLRGRGRHYPWPVQDVSGLPLNQWKSVNPENLPDGLTPLPSITNVTGVLHKDLVGYGGEHAIRAGYEQGWPDNVEDAVAKFKRAADRHRDRRAEEGTRAHTIAERLTQDLPLPESVSDLDAAYADAYMTFWADWSPEPLHVEATVLNPEVGYGGTGDLIARICDRTAVVDYKTRAVRDDKKIKKYGVGYDENRLQLAALANAPYLAVGTESYTDAPVVDEGWIVVLFPDGSYEIERLDRPCLDEWFDCFQGVLRAWRVLKGAPKGVAA